MSMLNSRDLLNRLLLCPDAPIPGYLLGDTGLDIQVLEGFVEGLAPFMDYLHGYQPLDNWFTEAGYSLYPIWFDESHLCNKYPYCALLLDAVMRDRNGCEGWRDLPATEQGRYAGETQRYSKLRVFLTRKREWIVWASYPNSVFHFASNVADAAQLMHDLTPTDASLYDGGTVSSTHVLGMFHRLRCFVEESNRHKQSHIDRVKGVITTANHKLSRFQIS